MITSKKISSYPVVGVWCHEEWGHWTLPWLYVLVLAHLISVGISKCPHKIWQVFHQTNESDMREISFHPIIKAYQKASCMKISILGEEKWGMR